MAQERAAILPMRDAMAAELHLALPPEVPADTVDLLARRLSKIALATLGATLTALAESA